MTLTDHNVLLTPTEKQTIKNWKYNVIDNSKLSNAFNPFWNWLVTFVPVNVSANIISLTGLIALLYAFNIAHLYIDTQPFYVQLAVAFLTFAYMNLDAIDGKHARRTNSSSSLGELFDHSCDNVGMVFMILTFCYCLGITSTELQWYIVQISQLVFLQSHIAAYKTKVVKFGSFNGPCEAIMTYIAIILLNAFGCLEWFTDLMHSVVASSGYSSEAFFLKLFFALYYIVLGYVCFDILEINNDYSTKYGLLISLLSRSIPSVLIYFGVQAEPTTLTVISHGLIMSVLCGDIIVSKMSSRELHQFIPVIVFISLLDDRLCILGCLVYYIDMLAEISISLRIPLFSVHRNVYCSGVFDMCHEGHLNLFRNSAAFGTRLFVGVHNDEDVKSYKRLPNMTHLERCNFVSKCQYVDTVIPNAPLCLTEEFIKEHNIHIVTCSAEYDSPDDKYYDAARKMGILKVLPRSEGISSSDIMKRIKQNSS
jgi:choline-phosphate cytidylyltransferase